MDYDSSESSYEARTQQLDEQRKPKNERDAKEQAPKVDRKTAEVAPLQPRLPLGIRNRSLSTQVMEYYQKYSRSANLEQYFSLPGSSATSEAVKYYYSVCELKGNGVAKSECKSQDCNSVQGYVPKERRRWVRPPLVGQSSGTENSVYTRSLMDPRTPSPDPRNTSDGAIEERNESQESSRENVERKSSPTSSVASHKPLEWDSGADIGYISLRVEKSEGKKLSTIERMALARGCSTALRLDPEGTTENGASVKVPPSTSKANTPKPTANSTPIKGVISETESEAEITPIVKNHVLDIVASEVKPQERVKPVSKPIEEEIPKGSETFRVPLAKYATVGSKSKEASDASKSKKFCAVLKKSTSMNTLESGMSAQVPLKRSQSDVNLLEKDTRSMHRLIFQSSSSVATIVNRPATCDKVIQTSITEYQKESIGVQVEVVEEESPPLPKRGTSLRGALQSILKNPKNTYKIQNGSRKEERAQESSDRYANSSDLSQESTPTPRVEEDIEDTTGRANSFEYFPGHIYENVPTNGTTSQVSTVGTGRSNSTMPNTSSSVDEKLWGDSDSLVRDLERSVNVLKSLVNANKLDQKARKRLIHHVVKRLVTANFPEDGVEGDNSWKPDESRQKMFQAFSKKQSVTDSSDEWKLSRNKKPAQNGNAESSNSDKFDGHTDRTETDGRKARMGLRIDDCNSSNKSASSDCFLLPRNYKPAKAKSAFSMKKKSAAVQPETTTSCTEEDASRLMLGNVHSQRNSVASSDCNSLDWRMPVTLSERRLEMKRCNNSDSGDAKLVNYAEMEKRNQLLWITNEISHLSNLKKLLEEPKRAERSTKSSPKKSSRPSAYKHSSSASRSCDRRPTEECNGGLNRSLHRRVCENSENEQWSSHCNLASRHQSSNEIKEVRKRNSCTQTATSLARAHSKTGGEIVAAAINGDLTKTSHACVQSSATCLHHAPFCKKTTQVLKHASPKGCPCYNSHSYFKENIAFNAQSTLLESQLEGPGASSEVPQNGRARNAVVNKDAKKCECNAAPVPKAVAYEICFDINNGCKSKAKDASRSFKQSYFVPKATPCACEELPAPKPPATKPKYQNGTLQDYLASNKPEFLESAETRRHYMTEVTRLRQLQREKRLQLLAIASTSSFVKFAQPTFKTKARPQKKLSDLELRNRLRKRYSRLNEVRTKRRQLEKQEEARRNKLMANIFGKKLQEKVLRGQVDLSQSVSVISNL